MTLTEAAYWTKKLGILGAIFILVVILVWQVMKVLMPPPTLPQKYLTANNACGQLLQIELNSIGIDIDYGNIQIETVSGAFPEMPNIVNVYRYNHMGQSLYAQEMAKSIAEQFKFPPDSIQRLSSTTYQFTQPEAEQYLTIETGNLNFDIRASISPNNSDTLLPDPQAMIESATSLLNNASLLSKSIDDDLTTVRYYTVAQDASYKEIASRANADFGIVYFYKSKPLLTLEEKYANSKTLPQDIREALQEAQTKEITTDEGRIKIKEYSVPILSEEVYKSNIYVGLKGTSIYGNYLQDLVLLHYINWPIDENPCGTYEIITPGDAVTKIQNGEAYLRNLHLKADMPTNPPPQDITVSALLIQDIQLVYYNGSTKQEYLQPIYMITGEAETNYSTAEFVFYVPAIKY